MLVKQSPVKMFLSLIRWLWFLNPYLHYVFPVVLFITSGKRIRMTILLYCTISTYDMITPLCMKLGLYLHAALRSFPFLGSYVLEFVNNQTQSVGKLEGIPPPTLLPPPLPQAGPNGFWEFRVTLGCSGQWVSIVIPPEWVLGLV